MRVLRFLIAKADKGTVSLQSCFAFIKYVITVLFNFTQPLLHPMFCMLEELTDYMN